MDMDERLDCGHTPREHLEIHELNGLVAHVSTTVMNPRVALLVSDDGAVHFATSLQPHEAAQMLEKMAARVRRYGSNYVVDHYDRGAASEWN
jgi:hypothetical protein